MKLILPTACDPDRVVYRYFGLERGRWVFTRWRVLAHYMGLIFTGWRPRFGEAGEDHLQLGGDFILSADRHLLFAHRSIDPADRPSTADILRQLPHILN